MISKINLNKQYSKFKSIKIFIINNRYMKDYIAATAEGGS